MVDENHRERARTEELVELPATPENMNAKLNFLCVHMGLTERLCHKAAEAAESSRVAAEQAKTAANNAATSALNAMQSREPLSKVERFGTVFGGAALGGAVAGFILALLGIVGTGASMAACQSAAGAPVQTTSHR